jgi:hypothetical protein
VEACVGGNGVEARSVGHETHKLCGFGQVVACERCGVVEEPGGRKSELEKMCVRRRGRIVARKIERLSGGEHPTRSERLLGVWVAASAVILNMFVDDV